jgi:hypothetical protein
MTRTIDALRGFLNGYYYPILIAFLIYLGHSTNLEILFLIFITIAVFIGCFLAKNVRFLIIPLFCTIFLVTAEHSPNVPNYSDYYTRPQNLIWLILCGVLLIAGVIAFVCRNWKEKNDFSIKSGLLPGILIFCVAMCFNGLGAHSYAWGNLGYGATFLFAFSLIYLLFAAFFYFDHQSTDYLMYCLLIAGLLICAELITALFTDIRLDEQGSIIKETVILGWGVWTTVGGMLCMLMPACFYFFATKKWGWLGLLAGGLEWICILLSQSRGALLFGSFILVLCIVAASFFGDFKGRNRYVALGGIVIAILAFFLLANKLLPVVQNFLNDGFGDNGRFELWKTGWERFKEASVFGTGFYGSYINEEWNFEVMPYMYHNTVIQFLGATGIVGMLAYTYHRIQTVRMLFHKPTTFKIFAGICILGLLLFSLLDVLFFNIYPLFYYSLLLLFAEREMEA